jgi:GNAT superfamily N-acetyltransferase
LKIAVELDTDPTVLHDIQQAINRHNIVATGYHAYIPVNVLLRDDQEAVKGGALGGIWGEWLHLNLLWVAEELRGQGFGSQLLEIAESEATKANCRGIYLETFDFQAYPFYVHYGYEKVGQLDDFPPGQTLYFLAKRLV